MYQIDYTQMRYRIKTKGHKKMNEKRSLVKTIIGFVLVIVVIIGGMYGFNVDVEIQDIVDTTESTSIAPPPTEITEDNVVDVPSETTQVVPEVTTSTPTTATKPEVIEPEVTTEVKVDDTVEEPSETEQPSSTTESTPVVDEQPEVDNSADTEVTEPTEEQPIVTEGDVENA